MATKEGILKKLPSQTSRISRYKPSNKVMTFLKSLTDREYNEEN